MYRRDDHSSEPEALCDGSYFDAGITSDPRRDPSLNTRTSSECHSSIGKSSIALENSLLHPDLNLSCSSRQMASTRSIHGLELAKTSFSLPSISIFKRSILSRLYLRAASSIVREGVDCRECVASCSACRRMPQAPSPGSVRYTEPLLSPEGSTDYGYVTKGSSVHCQEFKVAFIGLYCNDLGIRVLHSEERRRQTGIGSCIYYDARWICKIPAILVIFVDSIEHIYVGCTKTADRVTYRS